MNVGQARDLSSLRQISYGAAAAPVALVERALDPDDLRAFAAERLARYKMPERIVFAEDLPYSNLGKVSRKALAAVVLADGAGG